MDRPGRAVIAPLEPRIQHRARHASPLQRFQIKGLSDPVHPFQIRGISSGSGRYCLVRTAYTTSGEACLAPTAVNDDEGLVGVGHARPECGAGVNSPPNRSALTRHPDQSPARWRGNSRQSANAATGARALGDPGNDGSMRPWWPHL